MTDPNEHSDEPHFHAMAIPVSALAGRSSEEVDRGRMAQESMRLRVNAFLEGLSLEHLECLRVILNQDEESRTNQFWDGQIAAIMRLVHHHNDYNGKPLEADPRTLLED